MKCGSFLIGVLICTTIGYGCEEGVVLSVVVLKVLLSIETAPATCGVLEVVVVGGSLLCAVVVDSAGALVVEAVVALVVEAVVETVVVLVVVEAVVVSAAEVVWVVF